MLTASVFKRLMVLLFGFAISYCFPVGAANPGGALSSLRQEVLSKKIGLEGNVRLIVTLDTGSEPVLQNPRKAFPDNPPLHAQRQAAVARLQNRLASRLPAMTVLKRLKNQPSVVLEADSALLQMLQFDPAVAHIQEDHLSRPVLDQSVPLIGADIAAGNGFDGAGWAIAVLDSGVDSTHDFLAGKVIAEACFSTSEASIELSSLCPNGNTTQTGSGAGVNCSGTTGCDHGTHVAGIAAGVNSAMSGVAPAVNIIAVQVFSHLVHPILCGAPSCILAFDSDIISGLEYVYNNRASFPVAAVNLSLGGSLYDTASSCDADNLATKAAIDDLRAAGIATVIASGNEAASNAIAAPGCISTAVSVGATTGSDTIASFSNSASWLSLLAPGTSIKSSVPGNGFESWNGTSMATPHVAGAFAVLKSKSPTATIDELLIALTGTGVPITDPSNGVTTPRIQVNAAVDSLDTTPPPVIIIDNQDTNTTQSGSWQTSSSPDPWDGQSLYSGGSASFRWLPNLDQAEAYEIYAWWTYHKNRSTRVPYTIVHADGISTVEVNQHDPLLGGQWILLGAYNFAGDGSGYVEVTDPYGQACADAVRLVPASVPVNQPPVVAINKPVDGATFTQGDTVTLEGAASDSEDGELGGAISWHSSLDNDIGIGTPLSTTTLAVGAHTISAQITDSGGATAEASISLTVNAGGSGAIELFADNLDADTSQSGTWSISSGPDPWQGQSVYNDSNDTFHWSLNIPISAVYQVYAWWTYHKNRSTTVPYSINHAGGTNTVQVNQRNSNLGGQWILLGSYTFTAGTSHYVEVSSENGQASADAIRLVTSEPPGNFPPSISINSPADGAAFTEGDSITLTASAADTEDGDISANIDWVSSLDNALGSGSSLTTPGLSAGSHVISATITDSGGEIASDAISIIVNLAGAIEVVVDNQDGNTSKSGSWSTSSGPNPWAGQSIYSNSGSSFRWLPALNESGSYAVYAWWTYHAHRATNVPYRINHADGTATVNKNQRDQCLAAQWVLLGVYTFNGDGSAYVEVSSENGQASADAVKLVKQ